MWGGSGNQAGPHADGQGPSSAQTAAAAAALSGISFTELILNHFSRRQRSS